MGGIILQERTPNATVTAYYIDLSHREPGLKYEIYVTAISSTKESARSNVIAIETEGNPYFVMFAF